VCGEKFLDGWIIPLQFGRKVGPLGLPHPPVLSREERPERARLSIGGVPVPVGHDANLRGWLGGIWERIVSEELSEERHVPFQHPVDEVQSPRLVLVGLKTCEPS